MEFGRNYIRRLNGGDEKTYAKVGEETEEHFNLNMYLHPNMETISIEEFQSLGLQRLSVLRALERIKEKNGSEPRKYAEIFKNDIGQMTPFLTKGLIAAKLKEGRREDRISHFVLRLAYCQSVEMSEWFLRQETELFRMRFQLETASEISTFLKANNITPEEVNELEKQSILADLSQALTIPLESVPKSCIYKVDCWDVIDLFYSHRLYLKDGFAYINSSDLVSLVTAQFRENISMSLANARRNLGYLQEEDRLIPLMKNITSNGASYRKQLSGNNSGEEITSDMLDDLAIESFPLCMRNIHFQLRKDHHIRHYARQQYGLFLKGIGLAMEASMEFFRSEFTRKIDNEKFSKQYAYNIRHIYGKEGSRVDRKPFPCATIILGNAPTASDCHGCPYKHSEPGLLAKKLESIGLQENQIAEILTLSKINRFDKACTKYFEFTHNIPELEELITHPNQYYTLARKVRRGEKPITTVSSTADENMDGNCIEDGS